MGSTVLRGLLVLVAILELNCSALQDEPDMTQREVTFDLSEILRRKGTSQPDHDLAQREVTFDLEDLWEPEELPEASPDLIQREVTVGLPKIMRGRDRPVKLNLQFPPARPYMHNLPAICRYGEERPRYPKSSHPLTGYGYLSRQMEAVEHVESLYSFCCQRNGTVGEVLTLCCAQQAWEYALNHFCQEEFSIKTRHYHCCKKKGGARWSCFEKEAPDLSYQPTSTGSAAPRSPPDPGFIWNPDTCDRTNTTEEPDVPDIGFPPGRPTSSNIDLVCRLRKLRPRYLLKCLPSNSYGWLRRQSMAINRMEKGISQCCKGQKEMLACADAKWQVVMNRYCKEEHAVKDRPFPCCDLPEGEERYSCFSSRAPDPKYMRELEQRIIPSVYYAPAMVCDTPKLLKKKFSEPLPMKSLVRQCCHLPAAQRNSCVVEKLDDLMERMCTGKEPIPAGISPNCCLQSSHNAPNCLMPLLQAAIKKAKESSGIKKCPLD